MADQFPIVIRGYDKEQVDRAFCQRATDAGRVACADQAGWGSSAAVAGEAAGGAQPSVVQEPHVRLVGRQRPADACLRGADQHRAAGACQAGCRLDSRAAKAQAETLINNAKLDAQHLLDDAQAKADTITGNATNQAQTITTSAQQDAAPAARRNGEDRDRAASVRRSRTHQFARGA